MYRGRVGVGLGRIPLSNYECFPISGCIDIDF